MYDQTGFPEDDLSLGYAIDVFQESINKVFREYLVNFKYFIQLMEDYGFVLISKDEAINMNLPDSSGLFGELFAQMSKETKMRPNTKADYKDAMYMSPEEKQISFMNRYFVFKKIRNVDAKKMGEVITKQKEIVDKNGEENVQKMEEQATEQDAKVAPEQKIVIKKTQKKILLTNFTPVQEESASDANLPQPDKKPKLKIIGKK
jgi:hypothetical protein